MALFYEVTPAKRGVELQNTSYERNYAIGYLKMRSSYGDRSKWQLSRPLKSRTLVNHQGTRISDYEHHQLAVRFYKHRAQLAHLFSTR